MKAIIHTESSSQILTKIPKSVRKKVFHRGKGDCKLYWIHKPEHTDVKTEGYVGITSRSLTNRMQQHLKYAHAGANIPLSNAIRKYNNLIVEVLVIGTEEYVLGLENKLRPTLNIGWNIREGGSETVSEMMKQKWSNPEYREREIASRIKRIQENPHHIKPLSDAARRYAQSEEGREKTRQTLAKEWSDPERRAVREAANKRAGKAKTDNYKKVGSWLSSLTKHHIWEKADELYDIFMEDTSVSRGKFADKTGFTQNEIDCMHRKYFKKGWNPREDERWIDFYKNGGRDKYGK